MPKSAPKLCAHAGCGSVVRSRYCERHAKQRGQQERQRRGTTAERGYGSKWQRARVVWLKENPLCVECGAAGKLTPATVVDHIVPHRGDQFLFWDSGNWQSLCKAHHDSKTGRGE